MNVIAVVLLYAFGCSTVLVHGIGLERAYRDSRSPRTFFSQLPALALELAFSVPLSRALAEFLLVPHGLAVLMPMTVAFVGGLALVAVSALLPASAHSDTGEKIFLFGTLFLSVSEGFNFVGSLVIAIGSLIAFGTVTFLLIAVRERFAPAGIPEDWKGAPLILVSLGLLFIALYSGDAAWWALGGMK